MSSSEVIDNAQEQTEEASTQAAPDAKERTKDGERTEESRCTRCVQWMKNHHLRWLVRIPIEWPRTCSLIFGVIIPLFSLIAVSLFFGYGLAKLEAPNEIETNNDIIATRAVTNAATQFHNNVTENLPKICLAIYAWNQAANMTGQWEQDMDAENETVNDQLVKQFDTIFASIIDKSIESAFTAKQTGLEVDVNNTSDLMNFMTECGKTGRRIADSFGLLAEEQQYIGQSLSFNWIRCDGEGLNSSKLHHQVWGLPYANRTRLKPDEQEASAIADWRLNQRELYKEFMDTLLEYGARDVDARVLAFRQSLETANGFGNCYPNSAAGAWFWFTVMTTIGYGNTAPSTQGGQAMIYTLGFLSILLFAIILGGAGTIVVTIWDDFIDRTRLYRLNIPWIACIFWGCCYYSWMLVIAAVTQMWKADRLHEDMEFSEAFWFSYISTTTVGFGDYYLDHEVILREDLITFPLLFLLGFVLLANFFVKLTELITNHIPKTSRSLKDRLAESNSSLCPGFVHRRFRLPNLSSQDEVDDDTDDAEVVSAVHVEGDCEVAVTMSQDAHHDGTLKVQDGSWRGKVVMSPPPVSADAK